MFADRGVVMRRAINGTKDKNHVHDTKNASGVDVGVCVCGLTAAQIAEIVQTQPAKAKRSPTVDAIVDDYGEDPIARIRDREARTEFMSTTEVRHLEDNPATLDTTESDRIAKAYPIPKVKPIRERFKLFHMGNPEVYRRLVGLARDLKATGHAHASIGLLWERLRWENFVAVETKEPFKLNDNFRAEYARVIMKNETDLEGFFWTRTLRRRK